MVVRAYASWGWMQVVTQSGTPGWLIINTITFTQLRVKRQDMLLDVNLEEIPSWQLLLNKQPGHRKSMTHPLQAQLECICLSWSTVFQFCITCLHLLSSLWSKLLLFIPAVLMFPNPSGNLEHKVCSAVLPQHPSFQPLQLHSSHTHHLQISRTQVKSPFHMVGLAQLSQELCKGILAWRHQKYKGNKKIMNKR